MSPEREQPLDDRMQRAVVELSGLIQQHYPSASFRVSRGQDDPQAVHLRATVDVDDPDEVVDLIIDRVMALQIEDGLPIFVIPVRPRAGVEALREAAGIAALTRLLPITRQRLSPQHSVAPSRHPVRQIPADLARESAPPGRG